MEYIAFIHKENDDYVATVPDLNFTSSYGKTFVDAVHYIKEATELYREDLNILPRASTLETLLARDDLDLPKDAMPQLIDIQI